MKRYELYPCDGESGNCCAAMLAVEDGDYYLASEVDRRLDVESRALAAANERADGEAKWETEANRLGERIAELERDIARWLNARDVWAAGDKAKDARIAQLEKALRKSREVLSNYWTSGDHEEEWNNDDVIDQIEAIDTVLMESKP